MILDNFAFTLKFSTYTTGVNQFSDFMFDEYANNYKFNDSTQKAINVKLASIDFKPYEIFDESSSSSEAKTPVSYDWRDFLAINKVKDQKSCGSCYATQTVDAIESSYLIKTGKLTEFSVQEVIDCDKSSFGCSGGLSHKVFDYVKDQAGIRSAIDYPYFGKTQKCNEAHDRIEIKLKGFGIVSSDCDDEVLKKALIENGPIVVGIGIYHDSFYRYSSGIYEIEKHPDSSGVVYHTLLLVGFGTENEIRFWTLKNLV